MTPAREVEVAASEGVAVEAVLHHQLHAHAEHGFCGEAPVLVHDEGGLQVVVKGNDPRPVEAKVVRG